MNNKKSAIIVAVFIIVFLIITLFMAVSTKIPFISKPLTLFFAIILVIFTIVFFVIVKRRK